MLKAGIFVDAENAMRNGGWGLRYDVLRDFVAAQGAQVVRANAYLAIDADREQQDPEYFRKREGYRSRLRGCGFKLSLKPVRRYENDTGDVVTKANTDLELAIDAMLQARNLDYVVLVSGDGDFTRLVMALQDYGCRVDVVAFHNVSSDLRKHADSFCSGFLIPGLLPIEEGRVRGYFDSVNEDKYYGFVHAPTGLALWGPKDEYFCHGTQLEGGAFSNQQLAKLQGAHHVIEFSVREDPKGRQVTNAVLLRPSEPGPGRTDEPADEDDGTAPDGLAYDDEETDDEW